MKRDIDSLQNQEFDLLIVGGGIQGACVALEAAKVGLNVAIVDRSDFGGATSANSLKILHGGLRYLQHLDFRRMKESIESRHYFAKFAPHLVRPLSCIIPTEKWNLKHPFTMWCALKLNDLISCQRNKGLVDSVKIPSGKILSKKTCKDFFPKVCHDFEMGGAHWYDYLILNSERLTLECLHEAVSYGAVIGNYVEAGEFISDGKQVMGVHAKDVLGGVESFEIRAKTTLNSVGPWWNQNLSPLNPIKTNSSLRFAKAINLVVRKSLLGEHAVGLESIDLENGGDKRFFFVVPWESGTMIGTTYTPVDTVDPQNLHVSEDEIEVILEALREWFPDAKLDRNDIGFVHAGLLPIDLTTKKDGRKGYRLHGDTIIVDHAVDDDVPGLYSIKTVKYTTAPVVARAFVEKLGKKVKPNYTPNRPYSNDSGNLNSEWVRSIKDKYGNRADGVIACALEDVANTAVVESGMGISIAEVLYFIRNEAACCLTDVVLRRGGLVGGVVPSKAFLQKIATIMAKECVWNTERIENEINEVVRYFEDRGISMS